MNSRLELETNTAEWCIPSEVIGRLAPMEYDVSTARQLIEELSTAVYNYNPYRGKTLTVKVPPLNADRFRWQVCDYLRGNDGSVQTYTMPNAIGDYTEEDKRKVFYLFQLLIVGEFYTDNYTYAEELISYLAANFRREYFSITLEDIEVPF